LIGRTIASLHPERVGERLLGGSREVVGQTGRVRGILLAIGAGGEVIIGAVETGDGRLAGALDTQGTFLGLRSKKC
jgi:hypothetical protein